MATGTQTAPVDFDEFAKKQSSAPPTDFDEFVKSNAPAETTSTGEEPTKEKEVEELPSATPRLKAARGGKALTPPTRTEKEAPELAPYLGLPTSPGEAALMAPKTIGAGLEGLANAGKFLWGAGKDVYEGLTGERPLVYSAPGEQESVLQKQFFNPQEEQARKASQEYGEFKKNPLSVPGVMAGTAAAGHELAGMIPFIGPYAAGHAEHLGQTGNIPEEAATTAGEMLGGEILGHPVKTVRALGEAGGKVAEAAGHPFTIGMSGEEKYTKGVKPRARARDWGDAVARPGVQRALKEAQAADPESMSTIQGQAETMPEIRNKVWDDKIQPALDRQGPLPVDMGPVGQNVRKTITPEMRRFEPGRAQELEDFAKEVEKSTDVAGANGVLKYLNGKLESYFAKYPTARYSTLIKNPEIAGWESAREAVRGQVLDAMEAQGETQIREARQDYGGLKTIEKELERKGNVASRKSPISLNQVLGTLAGTGLGGGPGAVLGWGAGRLAEYLNDRDVMARRGIRGMNPPPEPAFTPPPPYQVPPPPVPAQFQYQVGAPAPPPPVPAAHAVQFPGTLGNIGGQLGARGQGGVRIVGQLPAPSAALAAGPPTVAQPRFVREIPAQQPLGRVAPQLPAPAVPPETNIPPIVEPQFAREEVQPLATAGERAPESQLGTVGRQGIRTTPAAELPKKVPAHAIQDQIDELRLREKDLRRQGNAGAANAIAQRIASLEEQVPKGFEETPPQKNLGMVGGQGRGGILGKVNKETELPKKKVNTEEEGIPYTKPMPVPASKVWAERGVTAESVLHHELAHLVLSGIDGFVSNGVSSHRHPLSKGSGATASVLFPRAQFRDPVTGGFDTDVVKNKGTQLADLFAAGAASDELLHGIDRKNNPGLHGDKRLAKELFKALDVPEEQHEAMFDAAVDRAKERLQHPGIVDLMKREASIREEGLPVEFHFSKNRAENIVRKAKGLYEQRLADQGTGAAAGYPGSEETVSAGEKAGAGESAAGATRKERIKPFTPPKNIYTFKIEGLPGAAEDVYTTREALTRRKAFDQIVKDVPGAGMYRMIKEEAPPVENIPFSQKAEDFGPEDVRVSTRVPSSVKATENPHTQKLDIDMDAVNRDPDLQERLANVIKEYPGVNRVIKGLKGAPQILDAFINHLADNLTWLHDQLPEKVRGFTRQWYDSAHRMTKESANKYGYSHEQSAAVTAAHSPQKDWFMNKSLADRTMDIFKNRQNEITTPEMKEKMKELDVVETVNNVKGAIKTLEKAKAKGLTDETVERAKNLAKQGYRKAAYDVLSNATKQRLEVPVNSWKVAAKMLEGKSLKDLPPEWQARWIRAFDETHNSSAYDEIAPNGQNLGPVRNADGKSAKVAWGSFVPIEKSINILNDGSRENISRQLGNEHKVRNFYNNIIDPNSEHPDVTIDTHAVAAARLIPWAGNDLEVKHNLGGGPSSNMSGSSGTYPVIAEAYRRAAQRVGLRPRELQSITWEGIRDLFPDTFKNEANKNIIKGIWNSYGNGNISLAKARNQIVKAAKAGGGFRPPQWLDRIRK